MYANDTPEQVYCSLSAYAENGRFDKVWDRLDPRFKLHFYAQILQLHALSSNKEIEDESIPIDALKECFVKAANSVTMMSTINHHAKSSRHIKSCKVDGYFATLIIVESKEGLESETTVQMVDFEKRGFWMLDLGDKKSVKDVLELIMGTF
jgi:hypothetical protein